MQILHASGVVLAAFPSRAFCWTLWPGCRGGDRSACRSYSALRNSHASLVRSRGQLQRRSRELREARDRFLATLHTYEQRLVEIGREKAEALSMAQELHRELQLFEGKQAALDRLLTDLDEAKEEAGFWSILRISELITKMRALLRGGSSSHG